MGMEIQNVSRGAMFRVDESFGLCVAIGGDMSPPIERKCYCDWRSFGMMSNGTGSRQQ